MPADDADALLRELKSKDPLLRGFALDQLVPMAKGCPRILRVLLEGLFEDDQLGEAYLRAFRDLVDDVAGLLPGLLADLGSPDGHARESAARLFRYAIPFLKRKGPLTEEHLETVLIGLSDSVDGVRMWSTASLGEFRGRFSPVAVPRLTVMLSDPSADVRRRAALALMDHGAEAGTALDSLADLALDSDERVRSAAFAALLRIGGTTSANSSRIVPALEDPSVDVKLGVLQELRDNRALPEPVLRKVATLLGDSDEQCILLALKVLSVQLSLTRPVVEEIEARAHHQDPALDARLRQFSRFARNLE